MLVSPLFSMLGHACSRRGSHAATVALVAIALPGAADLAADPAETAVEIVSPRNLATVVGPSVVEVRIRIPEDSRAERVVVRVDGKEVASLTAPPWRVAWNAGEATEGHRIEAILRLDDGSETRATVHTSALRINQVENVSLVNLYAVVKDAKGNYVTDLARDDFLLWENGRRQAIERFTAEHKPLRIAIVLDTSLTMEGNKLDSAREAALDFLDVLEPGDACEVLTFSDSVDVAQSLSADSSALSRAIRGVRARGGTALYDAIWKAADHLGTEDGRRVLVLLSDGRDEASDGLGPGSLHTLEEALDHALRAETMIFSIGAGKHLRREMDFYRRRSVESILRELAEATGGRAIFSSSAGRLRKAFEEVAADLRHQYSLAYTSDDPARDGSWRAIQLGTSVRGLEVVTRRGYYAPR